MDSFNSKYIETASSAVKLFYPRSDMAIGETIISQYIPNSKLLNALKKTDELYIYLYLKPLGDSILFLSTVQATLDYLKLTRSENMPVLYAQKDMGNLLKHCNLFKDALYIDEVEEQFAKTSKKKTVVMVTDGAPFEFNDPSFVFNTEDYVYPKFIEVKDGKIIKEYPSRPARYYLTFEREVGVVLATDPNDSLPMFELPDLPDLDKTLQDKIKLSFNFKKFDLYISLITFVHSKERQKQFGILRYLEVASKIQKNLTNKKVCFVLFAHGREERGSWNNVLQYIDQHPELHVVIYDSNNLEEIAYILARMNLNIGNDTGISYLASISRKENGISLIPTIITYSRHDFGKWSSGHTNVFPIYTKLARHLTDTNRSVGRDKIDLTSWGTEELAVSIPVETVVNKALSILNGN